MKYKQKLMYRWNERENGTELRVYGAVKRMSTIKIIDSIKYNNDYDLYHQYRTLKFNVIVEPEKIIKDLSCHKTIWYSSRNKEMLQAITIESLKYPRNETNYLIIGVPIKEQYSAKLHPDDCYTVLKEY